MTAMLTGFALAVAAPAALPTCANAQAGASMPMPRVKTGPKRAVATTHADMRSSSSSRGRRRFRADLATLAEQADRVDQLWRQLADHCDAQVSADLTGARAWSGLWDAPARSPLSTGFCRDLFSQPLLQGESVKEGMCAAEALARRSLAPGEIRSLRRQYSLDWDGCELPMPRPFDPT
jgi:hypothetical protein